MDKKYDVYYAKSINENISIKEHTQMVLDSYHELMKLKKIYFNEKFDKMIELSIKYHDIGKVNTIFQEKMRGHYTNDEIPHGYLSVLAVDFKKIGFSRKEIKEFKIIINSVFYHHRRGEFLKDRIKEFSKAYYEEQLSNYLGDNYYNLSYANLNLIYPRNPTSTITDEEWIEFVIVKGILNRCDWSASGNLAIEIEAEQSMKDNILKRFDLNSVQKFMMENYNENVAIVASTGAGKTEAALLWLNDEKGFFTLPMKVSANAIYQRIKEHYLLPINNQNRVAILHGDCYKLYDNDLANYHNARNLAYPLTVCTIDQIFKFAYKALGTEHLLATLKYSKVIIDELQAYSPDMLATIITALKYIHKIGGKFAIITATLPQFILDELSTCNIKYKRFIGNINNRHKITIHEDDMLNDLDNILDDAKTKKILVICNTVNSAQKLYTKLLELDSNTEIHLLHSRYTKKHRQILEDDVIEFSKSNRTGICVSTQIVEASLDIDFDVLYTYLSSIDSLIQRMGRVYRKRENINQLINVNIYTFKDGIGCVYDKIIYERTLDILKDYHNQMFLEEEKIKCMDRVYDRKELEKTRYMKIYNEKKEYLKDLIALQVEKSEVDNKFRNINSIYILPERFYNLKEVEKLIDCIKSGESQTTKKYELLNNLIDYCIPYTIYKPLKSSDYIDIKSCIKGEAIHRARCKYDFDDKIHKGIGLVINEIDDNELNDKYV
ncbi:CRISPR-associated helicase/endonuclease Cas3 [Thomasclavelia spiroformis DSM 1552]|uniref:CRISPR-associated helicase Cas3 n=1 Tax=Thomasclavelia spiroformis DSM 1552 TaxID=428126 RepID=B1C2J7_9FIRM|nr:CRISPR-associated helicase/endonuclease Cas3 [Thomasclavelia spiroformis]EDS74682.1 CRISPR-associated helicase Cas3 [Thomasclavelia spiroformis DSM 1552]UWO90625.1 CRISPR-associated helicase/endonuclease Cas3 [Thomasclavelia spiroformis DSM 1552]